MSAPGIGQPDLPGVLEFKLPSVTATAAGLPPSTIVTAGTPITLITTVEIGGSPFLTPILAAAINGTGISVTHHLQNLETGAMLAVAGGSLPPSGIGTAPGSNVAITSPPVVLTIPAGFAAGTYRALTHIHANVPLQGTIAAFHDGLVLMVTAP